MSVTVSRKNRLINEIAPLIKASTNKRIFVVHRHLGSILHYDLRVQIQGVLKCWAILRGPSMNAGDRRLAVLVDDRPLSYASVRSNNSGTRHEGIMEVWDKGLYVPHSISSNECSEHDIICQFEQGRLRFTLKGKKLKGVFSLVRLNQSSQHWLLLKGNDKFAVNSPYDSEDYIPENSRISKIIKSRNFNAGNSA